MLVGVTSCTKVWYKALHVLGKLSVQLTTVACDIPKTCRWSMAVLRNWRDRLESGGSLKQSWTCVVFFWMVSVTASGLLWIKHVSELVYTELFFGLFLCFFVKWGTRWTDAFRIVLRRLSLSDLRRRVRVRHRPLEEYQNDKAQSGSGVSGDMRRVVFHSYIILPEHLKIRWV